MSTDLLLKLFSESIYSMLSIFKMILTYKDKFPPPYFTGFLNKLYKNCKIDNQWIWIFTYLLNRHFEINTNCKLLK